MDLSSIDMGNYVESYPLTCKAFMLYMGCPEKDFFNENLYKQIVLEFEKEMFLSGIISNKKFSNDIEGFFEFLGFSITLEGQSSEEKCFKWKVYNFETEDSFVSDSGYYTREERNNSVIIFVSGVIEKMLLNLIRKEKGLERYKKFD